MKQPKLTVILPCYNVEKYLPEALDSVIKQTLLDIEIIPVDDGSPDNCAKIIREYAKKDQRIKPIYKQNGGYGSAVNVGIKAARGQYIAILEPDDYVMEDYYLILYTEAAQDKLDVCSVNSYCEIRELAQPKLVQTHWIDNPDYLSYEAINEYLASGSVGITLKIYRREFLLEQNITLANDLRAYHDVPFVAETLIKAVRARTIIGTGYYYRKDNITSTTKSKHNFIGIIDAITKVETLLTATGVRESRKSSLIGYCISHLLHYHNLTHSRLKNAAASEYIKTEIERLLTSVNFVTIHENTLPRLKALVPSYTEFKPVRKSMVLFNQCPTFDTDFFKHKEPFLSVLSKLYFFAYFAYRDNNETDISTFRNKMANTLNFIPGLRAKPISDFIKLHVEKAVYNFPINHNQSWYISFFLYLAQHEDANHFSFISDSINDCHSGTAVARFFPDVTTQYSTGYSSLDETFRKTMILQKTSISQQQAFLKSIKGKSIAIVGNSPTELGKNKGKDIDSYDVVIRFNNYSTDIQFQSDYGSKVNIWAITPGIESLNYQDAMYEYDFIISPKLSIKIQGERLDILYNYILSGGNFFQIDSIECRQFTNIMIPSIGLYILHFLSQNLNLVGKIGLFGFSPKTAKEEKRHYFHGDPVPSSKLKFHNWDKEHLCLGELEEIFFKHNSKV
jgi:glycosyltransferase involved in cell wall biosynthesis